MSERYPGGIISETAPVPSGPYQNSTAPGVWTMEQQAYFQQQGLWPIPGNVNPDAFIENLFSTYLYTGDDATSRTITNGIDLAGEGGLVWFKARNSAINNALFDTVRGVQNYLVTNNTASQQTTTSGLNAFTSSGFTVGNGGFTNTDTVTYASWTFREQPKFFDVVTWTGTGSGMTINHNLGSAPGMIIMKKTSGAPGTGNWGVWSRGLPTASGSQQYESNVFLNTTASSDAYGYLTATPTSTSFSITNDFAQSGSTYVAYLFAHNAGGFGTSGTDNVISCGSYTGNGSSSGPTITLGYEPQYVLIKRADSTGNWHIQDVMRSMPVSGNTYLLLPNSTTTEYTNIGLFLAPNATGFQIVNSDDGYNASGGTYIYMAIRRPMAVPTNATTVFNPTYGQSGAPGFRSTNFNAGIDTSFVFLTGGYNDGTNAYQNIQSRLTGTGQLQTANTRTEVSQSYNLWDYMNGQNNATYLAGTDWGSWMFKRASGFFDVVCYTGNGTAGRAINHNLTVAPELMIVKSRSVAGENWPVYLPGPKISFLDTTQAGSTSVATYFGDNSVTVPPTSSVFTVGSNDSVNQSAGTYVAYLFATCPGVSKVGSYTGTGTLTTINCGFTGGARFVMIKRTDSTGDWFVWDTVRGMTAGTDPSLTLNTYNAQSNANSVYTATTGFQLLASPAVDVNSSGGTYIFLAIA